MLTTQEIPNQIKRRQHINLCAVWILEGVIWTVGQTSVMLAITGGFYKQQANCVM